MWIAAGTVLAGLPGCLSHERPDAGKAPEGPVRVPGSTRPSKGGGGSGDAPASPTAGVIAVATSGIYHREGCTVLAESAAESRVPFATPWLALDAGHTPCGHCRPGP